MSPAPEYDQYGNPIAKKSTPWLKWVGIGCGGLVLLCVLAIVGFVFLLRQATAGPEQTVKSFLSAAAAGEYAAAYDHFSAPLKQAQSLEAFTNGVKSNPALFDVTDTTFSNRSLDLNAGAQLSGSVTLKAGTRMPASFRLVKENGDWKLIAYHIGSSD